MPGQRSSIVPPAPPPALQTLTDQLLLPGEGVKGAALTGHCRAIFPERAYFLDGITADI